MSDAAISGATRRFVVLRHAVGSGTRRDVGDHLDWMFEVVPGADLMTWSTPTADPSAPVDLVARRLPDHRRVYLEYEGPLSPNPDGRDRGSVRRLAAGSIATWEQSAGAVTAVLRWDDDRTRTLRVQRTVDRGNRREERYRLTLRSGSNETNR